jgi:hypothetical protein
VRSRVYRELIYVYSISVFYSKVSSTQSPLFLEKVLLKGH